MTHAATLLKIPATHPSLPGHFPGNPVVPGAVILSEVAAAGKDHLGAVRVTGFAAVKFLSPLRPEQAAEIRFTDKGAGLAAFDVDAHDQRIASGTLRYERA
jgi:3-hydroxymyristoyl/3-hydroxydecanoyl-(acyl carrier protein) dehydratase